MIKRLAMIKDGLVENVVLVDDESGWSAPDYLLVDVELEPTVGPGFTYVDGAFLAPVQPPEVIEEPPSPEDNPAPVQVSDLDALMSILVAKGIITDEQKKAILG